MSRLCFESLRLRNEDAAEQDDGAGRASGATAHRQGVDVNAVRENLAEITRRAFHLDQDLVAELADVLADAASC